MREGGDWLVEMLAIIFLGGMACGAIVGGRPMPDAAGSLYNERGDLNGGS